MTAQRERIFQALAGNTAHPTAEAVYASVRADMPSISLKTVYQTLNDLVAMGEIQQFELGTGSSRFDPNIGTHHHLVCLSCGKVRDLHTDFPGLEVPRDQQRGFYVSATEVVFRGLCEDCQETRSKGVTLE